MNISENRQTVDILLQGISLDFCAEYRYGKSLAYTFKLQFKGIS